MGNRRYYISLYIIGFIWAVWLLDLVLPFDFSTLGIVPRTLSGLKGIAFAPFIHAGLAHLAANTVPLLVLSTVLYIFYPTQGTVVWSGIVIVGGFLTWVLGRNGVHVGASGVVYGLASFLVFSGYFKRDFKAVTIAIVIIILYGSLVYGILPRQSFVSWEGHLFGAVSGYWIAHLLRNKKV